MSGHFIGHAPCPSCGSKDNLGKYSDGHLYCFGCAYYRPGRLGRIDNDKKDLDNSGFSSTTEITTYEAFPRRVKNWLAQYGIFEGECSTYNIVYESTKQLLLFGFKGGAYYTGRYFGTNPKHPKYLTGELGKSDRILTFENPKQDSAYSDRVILVEDYISAIMVGKVCATCPLFRAHVSGDKLKSLVSRFKQIQLWLDFDKYADALKLTQRYRSVGFPMLDPVKSEKDPKYYSPREIKEFLNGT